LAKVRFVITQLPLGEIGYTVGNTVYIDATAAGFGWYTGLSDGVGRTGHMDLLTVVLHEIGHTVGLPDGCACGAYSKLMQTTLSAGERRLLPRSPFSSALKPSRVKQVRSSRLHRRGQSTGLHHPPARSSRNRGRSHHRGSGRMGS
jgi:hypothetical protein